jgi:hypothetical protein
VLVVTEYCTDLTGAARRKHTWLYVRKLKTRVVSPRLDAENATAKTVKNVVATSTMPLTNTHNGSFWR